MAERRGIFWREESRMSYVESLREERRIQKMESRRIRPMGSEAESGIRIEGTVKSGGAEGLGGLAVRFFVFSVVFLVWVLFSSSLVSASPQGGSVVSGKANIAQAGGTTTIQQVTNNVIINWNSFNIGSGELVQFLQPSALSAALNRVIGGNPSVILGELKSNGRVFLINPDGILFGQGSVIDTGSFIASTLNISNQDFLLGDDTFNQLSTVPASFIVNQGTIQAGNGGSVVLLAPLVDNEGKIIANLGSVGLGAATHAVLSYDSNGLVNLVLSNPSGVPQDVTITPAAYTALLQEVVNNKGVLPATSVEEKNGEIVLTNAGGTLVNAGSIEANGAANLAAGSISLNSTQDTDLVTGSLIAANGEGQNSNGGDVVVNSEGSTYFNSGSEIEAEGGVSGNGGKVEVSDKTGGVIAGSVNVGAVDGQIGEFLIDPTCIEIGTTQTNANATFIPTSDLTNATANLIYCAVNSITLDNLGNNVVVTVGGNNSLTLETQTGAIIFENPSDMIETTGAGNITMDAGMTTGSSANMTLGNLEVASGNINLTASGSITLNGLVEAYNLSGGVLNSQDNINISAGNGITITPGGVNATAGVYDDTSCSGGETSSGNITIQAGSGGISMSAGSGDTAEIFSCAGDSSGDLSDSGDISVKAINGGNVNMTSTGGTVDICSNLADAGDRSGGSAVTLYDSGNTTVNAGGSLTMDSASGGGEVYIENDLVCVGGDYGAALTDSGNIAVSTGGNMTMESAGSEVYIENNACEAGYYKGLTASGSLDNTVTVGGSMTMDSASGGSDVYIYSYAEYAGYDDKGVAPGTSFVNSLDNTIDVTGSMTMESASSSVYIENCAEYYVGYYSPNLSLSGSVNNTITAGGSLTMNSESGSGEVYIANYAEGIGCEAPNGVSLTNSGNTTVDVTGDMTLESATSEVYICNYAIYAGYYYGVNATNSMNTNVSVGGNLTLDSESGGSREVYIYSYACEAGDDYYNTSSTSIGATLVNSANNTTKVAGNLTLETASSSSIYLGIDNEDIGYYAPSPSASGSLNNTITASGSILMRTTGTGGIYVCNYPEYFGEDSKTGVNLTTDSSGVGSGNLTLSAGGNLSMTSTDGGSIEVANYAEGIGCCAPTTAVSSLNTTVTAGGTLTMSSAPPTASTTSGYVYICNYPYDTAYYGGANLTDSADLTVTAGNGMMMSSTGSGSVYIENYNEDLANCTTAGLNASGSLNTSVQVTGDLTMTSGSSGGSVYIYNDDYGVNCGKYLGTDAGSSVTNSLNTSVSAAGNILMSTSGAGSVYIANCAFDFACRALSLTTASGSLDTTVSAGGSLTLQTTGSGYARIDNVPEYIACDTIVNLTNSENLTVSSGSSMTLETSGSGSVRLLNCNYDAGENNSGSSTAVGPSTASGSLNTTVTSGGTLTMQTTGSGSVYIVNEPECFGEYGGASLTDSGNLTVSSAGNMTMETSGTGYVYIANYACEIGRDASTASTASGSLNTTVTSGGSLTMQSTGSGYVYIENEPECFGEYGGASLTNSGNLTVSSAGNMTMETSGRGSVYIANYACDIGERASTPSTASGSLNMTVTSGGSLTMNSGSTGSVELCNDTEYFSHDNTGTPSSASNSMDMTVNAASSLQMTASGTGDVYICNFGIGQNGDFSNANNLSVTAGGSISLTSSSSNTGVTYSGIVDIGNDTAVSYGPSSVPSTGTFSNFGNATVTSTGGSISMNGIDTFMEADGPNTATGNLILAAAGGIGVTNLQSSGNMSLTASGGAITNNGGVPASTTFYDYYLFNGTNLTSGGNLFLSGTGIGSSSSPITASTGAGSAVLTAVTTGSGLGDYITESQDLGAISVTTNNGIVDIPFGSNLLTFDPTTSVLSYSAPAVLSFVNTGGNVDFTYAGNLLFGTLGASGTLNLNVSGGILGSDLFANTANLVIGGGVNSSSQYLNTSVTHLFLTSGGGFFISNTGNILTGSLTAGGSSVIKSTGVIGTGTTPVKVKINGSLSVASSNALDFISVDMNGTDTGMVLTVLNTPPGLVIFNGNPQALNPQGVGLIIGDPYYEALSQNDPYLGVVSGYMVNPCYLGISEPMRVKRLEYESVKDKSSMCLTGESEK